MGSGASKAIEEASQEELKASFQSLSAEERQKVATALAACKPKSLAPEKLESASDLLSQLREKKVSCCDLVEKSLARIKATEVLNACVEVCADQARAKAKAVDEKIASGSALGVLEGLPIVVKMNFDMAGSTTDASNPLLKGFVPESTSPVVQSLLDAGAIVVAKTNMPVHARNTNPFSPIYGQCLNPVNLANTCCGSSSGTAASVAAGIVSCGLGSDTGGSCRLPAICNGIAGFRPSPGRYSNDGCVPCVPSADTPGPLGTCVRDIMLMDTAVTGTKHDLLDASLDMLKGLKVALPPDWIAADKFLNKTIAVSWDVSVSTLADKGVDFVKEDMGNDGELMKGIANFMKSGWDELDAYLEKHRKSGAKHPALELSTKDFLAKSPNGEDKVFRPPDEDAEKQKAAIDQFEAGVKAADEFIKGYFTKTSASFMLTPCMSGLPPNCEKANFDGHVTVKGYRVVAETMSDEEAPEGLVSGVLTRYAPRWAGFLTSIAIPLPIKCQATGLPTGVILWGPKGSDAELLKAAAAVEAAFAGVDASKHIVSY
eukprot:TRINITY_DN37789_c0_g1_i2.p1 TRINITY_DN37789_c0_g1~~TRINITY_DN37789_c0_g1_i2.p1  ORF type:complete len:544 (-),score=106.68 TRINITY_DN37789_c0_g1_i2:100-1731(-)